MLLSEGRKSRNDQVNVPTSSPHIVDLGLCDHNELARIYQAL
jgi:hypothetical protein